jgi:predicted secreted protein
MRQRFTLAHELGHILIPWHIGSIIDEIDLDDTLSDDYYLCEAEANRFASELLMPTNWVISEMQNRGITLETLFYIAETAEVSSQAASIKFMSNAPPNYVLACSRENMVAWCLRSEGTFAGAIERGTDISGTDPYPFSNSKWHSKKRDLSYHLWDVSVQTSLVQSHNTAPWRELLHEIVASVFADEEDRRRFKASVNGVTSAANSRVRSARGSDNIVSAIIQRLHARAGYDHRFRAFVGHRLFIDFCNARSVDYLHKTNR